MAFPLLSRRPPRADESALPGPDAFGRSLRVELMRADRGRGRFCLAVFEVAEWTDDRGDRVGQFAEYLLGRLRATDYAGLLGAGRLGVILWDTDEAGAARFVEKIRGGWHAAKAPAAVVYAYPSDRPIGEPASPARTNAGLPPGFADDADDPEPRSADRPDDSDDPPPPVPVLPLEEVLLCPLPRWKRAVDVAGATVGLAALSPLLLATAAAVKLTSPGPVLFRQTRDGLGGRKFRINKFRTMVRNAEALKADLRVDSEQDGPAFKMERDPRITPVGRWLRKTCVDELPQLWNVLVGEMSLVGPRPLDSKEMARTGWWERRRLLVTPGLTCIWQVDGKSNVSFKEWMRMDIRYMDARTFRHDLSLIFRTAWNVALHRGSH